MNSDARFDWERMNTSSEARRRAENALAHALERSPHVSHLATRDALHSFVDVLVAEGLMPETAVITVKELLLRAHALQRYEPDAREQIRAALVSECISHYFEARTADDVKSTRPRLSILRGDAPDPTRVPDTPRPDVRP